MAGGFVRPATDADVSYVAHNLLHEDLAECLAITGMHPALHLVEDVRMAADAITLVGSSNEIVGIAGVTPTAIDTIGAVWLLCTPAIKDNAVTFLRRCGEGVDRFHKLYPGLVNVTDARNTLHHKLIRWCGFTLLATRPWGIAGLPFIEFAKVKT